MKLLEALQENNFVLEVEPELQFDNNKIDLTKKFISFCIKELDLTGKFTVKLVADREKHQIKTTAYYRDTDKVAAIYAKGRMLIDIMRSLAHELVHKQQYEQDKVPDNVPDIGGEIEDQANALAGVIIKKFLYYEPEGSMLVESKK